MKKFAIATLILFAAAMVLLAPTRRKIEAEISSAAPKVKSAKSMMRISILSSKGFFSAGSFL